MLHCEYHNHNPKIKQTRQFFPSPEQFDFWGYVFVTYHPRFTSKEYYINIEIEKQMTKQNEKYCTIQ